MTSSRRSPVVIQSQAVCQFPHRPSEPSPGADPGHLRYKGRVTTVCDGVVVRSAGVEPATSGISGRPLYQVGVRAHWSRHPVPTRITRLTRAGPQPCAAA